MHNLLLIQTFFFWCLSRPVLLLLPWHPAEEQASTNYGWTRPLNEMEIDYNCNWFHNGREASIPHQNLQAAQMPLLLGKKAINVINKNQFFFYNSMAKQYSKYFVFSYYVRNKIVVLMFLKIVLTHFAFKKTLQISVENIYCIKYFWYRYSSSSSK